MAAGVEHVARRGHGHCVAGATRAARAACRRAPAPTRLRCAGSAGGGGGSSAALAAPAKDEFDCGYRRDLDAQLDVEGGAKGIIGAGGQGVVRLATRRTDGQRFAVKTIKKRLPKMGYSQTLRRLRNIRREVDIQSQLGRSLNVCTLYDAFEDNDAVHLQLELCAGGALFESGDIASGTFGPDGAKAVARAVLQAIAQCHAHHVAFRDVKPENFLYLSKDAEAPLKLSDFGLAKMQKPSDPPYTTKCGTVAYVAPEVLQRSAGLKADLWSCGVLIYQLLSGRFPFTDKSGEALITREVFSAIQSKKPSFEGEPWDTQVPEEAIALVRSLLNKDPSARPTAKQALMCEWFCGPDGEDCVAHYQGSDDLAGTVVARLQRFATMGALRRSVLTSVASKMEEREQESDSLRRLYSEIQSSNGSADGGGIRFEDLVKGLEVRGYSLTREEVRELFEVVDVDHSGDISLSEWIAALTEWHTLEESAEWGKWARDAFESMSARASNGDAGGTGGAAEDSSNGGASGSGDAEESRRISIDAIADEVCDVSWDGAGLVCKQALKDTLKAAANGPSLAVDDFVRLCESDSEDDLSLYETRYDGEQA